MMFDIQSDSQVLRQGQFADYSDSFCEPIAMTSAYRFQSAEQAAARFSGAEPGHVYSRFTNPSVHVFEERVALLEAAEGAVAFASGMAALTAVMMAFAESGSNIVCSRDVFGTTLVALRSYFARFGVEVRVVGLMDYAAWEQAIDQQTRLVFVETPSNPMQDIVNIAVLARMAHAMNALLVVDNTLLTPIMQQPLLLGADLVLHSAGKYMDGQGRCVAGVVCGPLPLITPLRGVLRTLGFSLSPMNAWLLLKSLEMLSLRMVQINQSALQLASWLEHQQDVQAVYYSGLESHPCHTLACQQQAGFGGVFSFKAGTDRHDAWVFINALRLISIATNIGDTRSMVTHPASTTHGRLSAEERQQSGISENLVRLSIGLETSEDLIRDLAQALMQMRSARLPRSFTLQQSGALV
ncbi:aminotransferase class I/II-fold pyridoxal phosphate-dependent enzyme [Iodobacter sp. HSC-16F04]|uniref:Aminotransferase class I/II-fold pyridoxal phosphate-dependent enzyme n=2 Tax=Iodobacter violaceini TaxID=3044271 RepID=A0ABX0KNG9_9NEIS|nr:aminotransferase class I/II-fold pyridoxal phosphate-dependent enzyme [Iodobacter violacea]